MRRTDRPTFSKPATVSRTYVTKPHENEQAVGDFRAREVAKASSSPLTDLALGFHSPARLRTPPSRPLAIEADPTHGPSDAAVTPVSGGRDGDITSPIGISVDTASEYMENGRAYGPAHYYACCTVTAAFEPLPALSRMMTFARGCVERLRKDPSTRIEVAAFFLFQKNIPLNKMTK